MRRGSPGESAGELIGGLLVLAAVGGIIYLYYLYFKYMLVEVGPDLFVVTVFTGIAASPVLYAIAANYQYDFIGHSRVKPWKWLLSILCLAILALIYVDIITFLIPLMAQMLDSVHAQPRFLYPIWKFFWGIQEEFFNLPSPRHNQFAPLYMAGVKSFAVVALLLIIRGMESHSMGTRQPAKIQYFFKDAFDELKNFGSAQYHLVKMVVVPTVSFLFVAHLGWWVVFLIPVTLSVAPALLLAFVACVGALLIIWLMHAVSLCLILALNHIVCFILSFLERSLIWIRSGYAKCPYSGCHKAVALPHFQCPSCLTYHDKLYPGEHGILKRECRCTNLLSTILWLGKKRLEKVCPHCGKPLQQDVFGGNLHVPIYGGPSSGKTMYLMATAHELVDKKNKDLSTFLIDEREAQQYNTVWKPNFKTGKVRDKTNELLPDALLMGIQRDGGLSQSVYLYDPAGEALLQSADLQGHSFLKWVDGVVLVLDPLALDTMSKKVAFDPADRPSSADPLEVLQNIVNVLESRAELRRDKKFNKRLAILVSKMDVPSVKRVFEGEGGNIDLENEDAVHDHHDILAQWFEKNERALYQEIETRFKDFRFFGVSALGHSPVMREAFKPMNVVAPIRWLLDGRRAFSYPRLYKWGIHAMEATIVGILATLGGGIIGFSVVAALIGVHRLIWT